ncbi:MAG TPA: M28 family peptidase [Bacteroidales bacterium]|nr:M28 family peptidase [Bacteroidales bacterium]
MTKKKLSGLSLLLLFFLCSKAQDRDYARSLIDSLASPYMYGRAYVNKGDSLAAAFIASQFETFGLKCFDDNYYQPFTLNANTFPAKVNVKLNGVSLKPGDEFAVNAASHSDRGEYRIRVLKGNMLNNTRRLQRFDRRDHSGHYIYFDLNRREIQDREILRMLDSLVRNNTAGARGAIFRQPAISWHAWSRGMRDEPFTSVNIRSDLIPRRLKTIETDIENHWLEDYVTRNVIAWIPGKLQPDSFLVVTAHYDHIGMMGQETVFPGANDNASGTAMLIDLARHYSLPENRHDYSMAFMAFSGEESGLLGSEHYIENPFFPLEQIRFLINLDMVGTGSEGLLVFNGTTDSLRFENMNRINQQNDYLTELRMRGISRSSDHYYFHQKGVPAFFLLTIGPEHRHYHNIYDTREALPLTKYNEVFRLITDFFDTF